MFERQRLPRFRSAAIVLTVLALPIYAQPRNGGSQGRPSGPGTGNPEEQRVSWHFLQENALRHETPLTLYWIPSASEDLERSQMLRSQTLLEATTRCVDLEIILPTQSAVINQLGLAEQFPVALILDRQGHVARKVESIHGELAVKDVESMVKAELQARDEQMYDQMTTASRDAKEGNKDAAIELYKRVWEDRCLFKLAGTEAQRALKELGVIVEEKHPVTPAPALPPPQTDLPHGPGSKHPRPPGRGHDF